MPANHQDVGPSPASRTAPQPPRADVCIVGAGPAGAMLSLLLARQGISVMLLEHHADLDRDFRGDTVHAATLEVLDQIGLADDLLTRPHERMTEISLISDGVKTRVASFARLPSRFPFIAMMPQVEVLQFLCGQAEQYPYFQRVMSARVTGPMHGEDGRVTGVRYRHDGQDKSLSAAVTVACDGRFSQLRRSCGLAATTNAPPMDVAWLRLPRYTNDPTDATGFHIRAGNLIVLLRRTDEWQLGYIFPKGDFRAIARAGLPEFRAGLAATLPAFADRVDSIQSWSDCHVLKVASDCLERWYLDGLLLIGDAAHVMSPVGGVGINVAIADAVETANVLVPRFQMASDAAVAVRVDDLAEVQARRLPAVQTVQRMQGIMQRQLVARALANKRFQIPLLGRILLRVPWLRDLPARFVSLGPHQARLSAAVVRRTTIGAGRAGAPPPGDGAA